MSHVVLLGDSIFDNAAYVNSGPAVIDQLRGKLPDGWRASLLAVDGHITMNVLTQLENLPGDATHLVVSVGGNDALNISPIFSDAASSVAEVFDRFAIIQNNFRRDYAAMLAKVLSHNKPATVCTIYDAIPGLDPPRVTGLALFNDVIFREACNRWAFLLEVLSNWDAGRMFGPKANQAPLAIVNVLPAVEFLPFSWFTLAAGVQVSLIGKNNPYGYTPTLAIFINF